MVPAARAGGKASRTCRKGLNVHQAASRSIRDMPLKSKSTPSGLRGSERAGLGFLHPPPRKAGIVVRKILGVRALPPWPRPLRSAHATGTGVALPEDRGMRLVGHADSSVTMKHSQRRRGKAGKCRKCHPISNLPNAAPACLAKRSDTELSAWPTSVLSHA